MQSLTLQCWEFSLEGRLGWIHCPQLRTLTLRNCDKSSRVPGFQTHAELACSNYHQFSR